MTQINEVTQLHTVDGVAVLAIDSPPVNALGAAVRRGLQDGLRAALADAAVRAVVIACAGRTFCAGADISEFDKPLAPPHLVELFASIDAAEKPVVAAIHGTALGGGLELALACHYRIAAVTAQLGLPEVALGLLPGGGGTQRAPRLVGVADALEIMVLGQPMSALIAQAKGLVDVLATEADLREDAVRYARRLADTDAPLRRTRDLATDLSGLEAASVVAEFTARNARLFKGFKAPLNIVKAVEAAAGLPFDQGIAREAELFDELMASRESAAQRHLFFAERAAAKIPGLAREAQALPVKSVAVIGAGTMGSGIATTFLNAGLPVTLVDRSPEALERAGAAISSTLRAAAAKGRITSEVGEAQLARLTTSAELSAVADADLVVEAVFEQLELKKAVFADLDHAAKPGAILASNTSFLDLNAIAAATSRPQDVVGLHFFAPANVMRLLEVVRGEQTSDAVLATAMGLGRRLKKVAVLSGVCDGFIANRLMARRGEAADRLILRGPMPRYVDKALTGFGFPMGVFAMLDLVGLDVVGWDRETSAGRTVQEVLCERGRWGQKQNGGYYDYDDQRRPSPSPVADEIIREFRTRQGVQPRCYADDEIIAELLYPVVNEGAKLLEEGVALRASDIDMALVAGYAWPTFTGGPMFWGDTVGLPKILAHLKAKQASGDAIAISPLLERLATTGGAFTGR
ncbi:3-hydroxyacyl-CoA dehydrogenase NAD-binding domain-containing protein [Phenylobacterium sp. LjRoot225]|uniref:3-hydroxyacyl-CoA dehydrogenase NAD-binding domain-containing protein n=1 Tax=Phenylobacterium sp. LjRoot225 TaxID=3342285 RepID=UPI003ED0906F